MLYVLYANVSYSNHQFLLQRYLKYFPVDYQFRIARYRHWRDAQLSILGRLLVQKGVHLFGVKDYVFDKIQYNSNLKPFIHGSDIKFNISHSADLVVCAIGLKNELGIDIEMIRYINISDFKGQMTKEEWRRIKNSHDSKCSFFEYWTQKEAVVKAIGKGLFVPLKSFVVKESTTQINGNTYYLEKINIWENYVCHISSDIKILSEDINLINFSNTELAMSSGIAFGK